MYLIIRHRKYIARVNCMADTRKAQGKEKPTDFTFPSLPTIKFCTTTIAGRFVSTFTDRPEGLLMIGDLNGATKLHITILTKSRNASRMK